jgi:hypothetical protein
VTIVESMAEMIDIRHKVAKTSQNLQLRFCLGWSPVLGCSLMVFPETRSCSPSKLFLTGGGRASAVSNVVVFKGADMTIVRRILALVWCLCVRWPVQVVVHECCCAALITLATIYTIPFQNSPRTFRPSLIAIAAIPGQLDTSHRSSGRSTFL